jgi:acyl-CoA reductase-like NAD-dependent aldehyde dehydrogenase
MFMHYINGKTIDGSGKLNHVINPATEELVGSFHAADATAAKDALVAADAAFPQWSRLSQVERDAWILKLKEALLAKKNDVIDVLMAETGKPLSNAEYDFGMLIQCLEYFPEEAKRLSGKIIEDSTNSYRNLVIHQPLGVIVGYLAWNFPLLNVGYKLGPVLASGCTCILKPSTKTPLSTMMVGSIAESIGFPAGVINILAGSHSEIAPVLNTSEITKMITLIGSSRAGREIIRESANSIKRYSLELGGNAPAIIMTDADIQAAAASLCGLKFDNAGQICVNVNRTFVHESVYEDFVSLAKKHADAVKLGWGREEGAMMGPMISKADQRRMGELVEDAVSKGAKIVSGGHAADLEKGNYFLPTVLVDVTEKMKVYSEEIFGPILPILKFNDSDDMIARANDTEYGLASYLFTKDYQKIFTIGEGLKFGSVCVNGVFFAVNLPHGGVKESGIGKDCSSYSLEEYYYIKRISIKA